MANLFIEPANLCVPDMMYADWKFAGHSAGISHVTSDVVMRRQRKDPLQYKQMSLPVATITELEQEASCVRFWSYWSMKAETGYDGNGWSLPFCGWKESVLWRYNQNFVWNITCWWQEYEWVVGDPKDNFALCSKINLSHELQNLFTDRL